MTVTVKETGKLKKISDYHVVVEDASDEYADDADMLKAYHIYLADQTGAEVTDLDQNLKNGQNLNLRVTLTYDQDQDWFDQAKDIKHYGRDGGEQTISGISFGKDKKTISFNVRGFSDFVISSGSTVTTGEGTQITTQEGSILDGKTFNDANEWQIVSGKYTNNTTDQKTVSSDGFVRVQKSILPGGTENEFYVYMSIDVADKTGVTKTVVDQWLSTATYCCGSSTHGSGNAVGSLGPLQGEPKDTGNHYVHVILKYDNKVIGETDVGCDVSNPSLYLCLTDNPKRDKKKNVFILLLETLGSQSGELDTATVDLSAEAYNALVSKVEETTTTETGVSSINVREIIDITRFKQVSVEAVDGSFNTTNGIWEVRQDTPTGTSTETTGSGNTTITTVWKENVAELLYKVTLNTTDTAFDSSNGVYYPGNSNSSENTPATATYRYGTETGTVTFPNVSVKGLQYDVTIRKVDEEGNPFGGITFTLTGNDGNGIVDGGYNMSKTTDDDGYLTFSGMAWGAYTIEEGTPPAGYRKADNETVTLCHTTNPNDLADALGDVGIDKIYKDSSGNEYLEIVNKKNKITITKTVAVTGNDIEQADVTQTIYFALLKHGTEDYVIDTSNNIRYATINITGGVPDPQSVEFEGVDTGNYDVIELRETPASGGTTVNPLSEGYRFTTAEGKKLQVAGIAGTSINISEEGTTVEGSNNNADLRYSNHSQVQFTNTYSHQTTVDKTVIKKWMSEGREAAAPDGAFVTFKLYRRSGSNQMEEVPGAEITLDGTIDGTIATGGELTAWQATFVGLDAEDDEGNSYSYFAREVECPNEYEPYASSSATAPMGQDDYLNLSVANAITNKQKTTSITIKKEDDKGSFLPGAEFSLVRVITDEEGDHDIAVRESMTISEEGGVLINGLVSGTYKLTETASPPGYIITNRSVVFTVNATGTGSVVAWSDGQQPESVKELSQTNGADDTITVINIPGAELPETGGTGFISPQTLCGIMAMAFVLATAVMYGFNMRRGERRSQ